jgi:hypothetical protein
LAVKCFTLAGTLRMAVRIHDKQRQVRDLLAAIRGPTADGGL